MDRRSIVPRNLFHAGHVWESNQHRINGRRECGQRLTSGKPRAPKSPLGRGESRSRPWVSGFGIRRVKDLVYCASNIMSRTVVFVRQGSVEPKTRISDGRGGARLGTAGRGKARQARVAWNLTNSLFRKNVQDGWFPVGVAKTRGLALGAPLRPASVPPRPAPPRLASLSCNPPRRARPSPAVSRPALSLVGCPGFGIDSFL